MVTRITYILAVLGRSLLQQPATDQVGQNVYVVLVVTLIVWLGVFGFLLYLDNQLKKLKDKANLK